jgi:hypothetical protein
MAISSSSATFTRFFVPELEVGDFWSFVDEKLRAGAFTEPDDSQTDAAGFTSWEDFFDPSFSYGSYRKAEYVAFNFRLDQKKVPAVVLKQFVRQSVQKYRDEHEGKWPSRSEKQQMQETMQEYLLSRAFPQPCACEVVWAPANHLLVLGTTSTKMMDAFLEFFERHFQTYPAPLYHAQWAANMLPLTPGQKDTLGALVSLKSPTALTDGRFLGSEFLTWLWYYIERMGGSIQAGEKLAEVHLGERMTLVLPADGKEKVVCTTQANFLHEARTALRQGKVLDEVQLLVIIGENEYTLTLDSSLWALKGLKTPKQLPDYGSDDPDGRFLEKMYFIEELSAALDGLYMRFLSERLTPGWESDTLVELQKWIDEGGASPETSQSPTAVA